MKKCVMIMFVLCLSLHISMNVEAVSPKKLSLASKSAILVDSTTGRVLYEKNGYERMYPASLTKIATAIYALENGNLNDIVTISKNVEHTDGTKVYLVEGEQVTLKHLIQGLLINSGNDAGVAIAEHMSGSVSEFAKNLNTFLMDKVGVSATHFVNPHGLFAKNHYTTAYDIAKITNYAMKNKTFRQIFETKELSWNGKEWKTVLITHHLMLKGELEYKEVTGGKTGYVNESGQTLATTAENKNIRLTVITMDAKTKSEAYNDTKKLLDYGFKYFVTSSLPKGMTYKKGEEIYIIPHKIMFTKLINSNVSEHVSKNGELKITDRKGMSLESFQLSPIKVKAEEKENTRDTLKESDKKKWYSYPLIMIIVIGSAGSIIKLFRSKRTNF
ncbi:D-alanyl-D-alanine carboxypeptidase [Heyndrickxia sporothermodurans]|uniref:D-alanyl-D-alanine carboxypeptidase n=4 Tax=Heyndrickxia sporothermodurans TaxID=46224 RepID=A0AB37H720_9BACI|nr:D-alanyl-D-alanine carboxypeptidase family protein [Heyndrickxia sporothermodurans]MBL5767296.1 D-alanyl-D-alanine carboxypeptidase [Heyndrickxia sporothermodurans]MBL5771342.1 D-alanyl-D-alanine carboxypeptidase [Heyndrickxia sporothermodurans]MBL5774402.1 D-alanyl-D-alanine carboxypeptidase [Heyndrickxia sporothermodurans]MBL5777928.1 D-alanyl-D-alanine carboxypeptidase [Heyndrickxia sporothermodurans]MBL5781309.1 D-alanyl-D-alanine carboxypeptidase [Heyndrickxia sporothermodurans]